MAEYKKVTVLLPERIAEKFNAVPAPVRLTEEELYKPDIGQVVSEVADSVKEEFSEWLEENHEVLDHADKREKLMQECTHPESHRIYPDHTEENNYNDNLVWHCTACGYARYKTEQ